ncbi:MAG: chemotaxis protein [Arcobacter sp.]|nr:chemotaxis protein [Arcobacter sp.]
MNKTYRNFLLLFIIITMILLFFLNKYNKIIEQNQTDILVSNKIKIVENELLHQKNQALSLSILFSQNQNIVTFLEKNDQKKLKVELVKLLSNIKNYTSIYNIQVQVHTKELEVFVRSWEDEDLGLSLKEFRKGLVKVKETEEPFVSNELGKRFNIKAISPIFDKDKEYIGSIEVIIDYSDLKNRLKYMGIEIIPLLEKKYLKIAQYHKENQLLHEYVVLKEEYDKNFFHILQENKNYISNEFFYYEIKNKIVTQIPLGNMDLESIGKLMIYFDKNEQDYKYLPRYEYLGEINSKSDSKNSNTKQKKEIIIK